eukprot:2670668-Alexandrium_andersonii.AAC.1
MCIRDRFSKRSLRPVDHSVTRCGCARLGSRHAMAHGCEAQPLFGVAPGAARWCCSVALWCCVCGCACVR